uniref:Uncharacterized protein n=1 Tax=Oryza meridionalis TaxID=40149 RepID=A0A0E0CJJ3_9ORYZ
MQAHYNIHHSPDHRWAAGEEATKPGRRGGREGSAGEVRNAAVTTWGRRLQRARRLEHGGTGRKVDAAEVGTLLSWHADISGRGGERRRGPPSVAVARSRMMRRRGPLSIAAPRNRMMRCAAAESNELSKGP